MTVGTKAHTEALELETPEAWKAIEVFRFFHLFSSADKISEIIVRKKDA
jgi:hypothetical protein